METTQFAKLIKKCAFEQLANNKRRLQNDNYCSDRAVCNSVAAGMGFANNIDFKPYGEVVYLLLHHAWNDILDWADVNGAGPG